MSNYMTDEQMLAVLDRGAPYCPDDLRQFDDESLANIAPISVHELDLRLADCDEGLDRCAAMMTGGPLARDWDEAREFVVDDAAFLVREAGPAPALWAWLSVQDWSFGGTGELQGSAWHRTALENAARRLIDAHESGIDDARRAHICSMPEPLRHDKANMISSFTLYLWSVGVDISSDSILIEAAKQDFNERGIAEVMDFGMEQFGNWLARQSRHVRKYRLTKAWGGDDWWVYSRRRTWALAAALGEGEGCPGWLH